MSLDQVAPSVVANVVAGVLVPGLLALAATVWRWRLLSRYGLSLQSKRVLESLWDANLLRRSGQIADELDLYETAVLASLKQLQELRLVRVRFRPNGKFWKITLRGSEYLRQRSWLE